MKPQVFIMTDSISIACSLGGKEKRNVERETGLHQLGACGCSFVTGNVFSRFWSQIATANPCAAAADKHALGLSLKG